MAGLQYTLTCVASVVPHTIIQPYITWLDPLGNITAEKASGTSLDLKFSVLTLSAQGQYTCRVTLQFDSLGQTYTAEETVSVDVEGTVWCIHQTCYCYILFILHSSTSTLPASFPWYF